MSAKLKWVFLLLLAAAYAPGALADELLIRYPAGATKDDFRFAYPVRVLQLALDKTSAEYGPARAVYTAASMTRARNIAELARGELVDVITSGASRELEQRFLPVPICIRKGILGIRLFLIDERRQPQFAQISSLDDLKHLPLGQGDDWVDTAILRSNGFNVVTTNQYESLFQMLMAGRFEYFPRALHEPFIEARKFGTQLPGLAVEKHLALYYPNPDYFWVNKNNSPLAERLRKGMETAIADGSFDKLFDSEFGQSIRDAQLNKRVIFAVRNDEIGPLPHAGEAKYWFVEQFRHDGKARFVP